MNCFRKTRDKGKNDLNLGSLDLDVDSKKNKKGKRMNKNNIEDERDGNRFSRPSADSEKSTSCCRNGSGEYSQYEDEHENEENGMKYETQAMAYLPVSKNDPFYNMNHRNRGKAVILNFDRWACRILYVDNTTIPDLGLTPRLGSEKDKNDLAKCLEGLDFDVSAFDNCGNLEMWNILGQLRNEDHTNNDCLIVAIMTHGERNTFLVRDGTQIPVNLIWEHFEANRCPSLAGKPKIFIIQACRGKTYDSGTKLVRSPAKSADGVSIDEVDSATFSYVIPNAADIIVAFSCPLGHYSWRSPENGSWFIQAICKVFESNAYKMDLQALFTTVAREVALNYQSNTTSVDSHKKKQVTSTSSTLIRTIRFSPKDKTGGSGNGNALILPNNDKTENENEELESETSNNQTYL